MCAHCDSWPPRGVRLAALQYTCRLIRSDPAAGPTASGFARPAAPGSSRRLAYRSANATRCPRGRDAREVAGTRNGRRLCRAPVGLCDSRLVYVLARTTCRAMSTVTKPCEVFPSARPSGSADGGGYRACVLFRVWGFESGLVFAGRAGRPYEHIYGGPHPLGERSAGITHAREEPIFPPVFVVVCICSAVFR